MKRLFSLVALSLLWGTAVAQDSFDRDFSKFDKDFERLNSWKTDAPASKKLKRPAAEPATTSESEAKPADAAAPKVTPLDDGAADKGEKTDKDENAEKADGVPKGAKVEKLSRNDLLGSQISDPVMRKKVQDLYKRPDVVVQQYVMPTN